MGINIYEQSFVISPEILTSTGNYCDWSNFFEKLEKVHEEHKENLAKLKGELFQWFLYEKLKFRRKFGNVAWHW